MRQQITLNEKFHRELKIYCAIRKENMIEILDKIVEQFLKNNTKNIIKDFDKVIKNFDNVEKEIF